jgi:hypothetical protein
MARLYQTAWRHSRQRTGTHLHTTVPALQLKVVPHDYTL